MSLGTAASDRLLRLSARRAAYRGITNRQPSPEALAIMTTSSKKHVSAPRTCCIRNSITRVSVVLKCDNAQRLARVSVHCKNRLFGTAQREVCCVLAVLGEAFGWLVVGGALWASLSGL